MRKLIATLALTVAMISGTAQAGLITASDDSFIDTDTNLEWIKFGVNDGQSYNQTISTLTNGWRVATQDEIFDLFKNSFYQLTDRRTRNSNFLFAESLDDSFDELFEIVGFNAKYRVKPSNVKYALSEGLVLKDNNEFVLVSLRNYEHTHADSVNISTEPNWGDFGDKPLFNSGAMLVKEVPEPSTLILLSLALGGLLVRKRIK